MGGSEISTSEGHGGYLGGSLTSPPSCNGLQTFCLALTQRLAPGHQPLGLRGPPPVSWWEAET